MSHILKRVAECHQWLLEKHQTAKAVAELESAGHQGDSALNL